VKNNKKNEEGKEERRRKRKKKSKIAIQKAGQPNKTRTIAGEYHLKNGIMRDCANPSKLLCINEGTFPGLIGVNIYSGPFSGNKSIFSQVMWGCTSGVAQCNNIGDDKFGIHH